MRRSGAAAGGIPAQTGGAARELGSEWATDVRGFALDCGHYLAEEAPEVMAVALIEFFSAPQARATCLPPIVIPMPAGFDSL